MPGVVQPGTADGHGGQISLAQFSFVGLGAVLLPHLDNHLPWAIAALLATLITALIGAVVALPALRLQGSIWRWRPWLSRSSWTGWSWSITRHGQLRIGPVRPTSSIFNFTLRSQESVVPLLVAVVALYAVGILAIRRGVRTISSGVTGCTNSAAALGLNLVRIKVIVFIVSSGWPG